MKLDTKEVREGKYIGQELWICDYRYTDFNNKPIRHVPPTKVNCLSIKDTDKRVYHSECFFREGNKKSSLIRLFDNTWYRMNPETGTALNVFTMEEECRKYYLAQKKKLRKEFQEYKKQQLRILEQTEKELE